MYLGSQRTGPPPVPLDPFREKRARNVVTCPAGCEPSFVLQLNPQPHLMTTPGRKHYCRCLRCLTYWEVNHQGEVDFVRPGADVEAEKARRETNGKEPQ